MRICPDRPSAGGSANVNTKCVSGLTSIALSAGKRSGSVCAKRMPQRVKTTMGITETGLCFMSFTFEIKLRRSHCPVC